MARDQRTSWSLQYRYGFLAAGKRHLCFFSDLRSTSAHISSFKVFSFPPEFNGLDFLYSNNACNSCYYAHSYCFCQACNRIPVSGPVALIVRQASITGATENQPSNHLQWLFSTWHQTVGKGQLRTLSTILFARGNSALVKDIRLRVTHMWPWLRSIRKSGD